MTLRECALEVAEITSFYAAVMTVIPISTEEIARHCWDECDKVCERGGFTKAQVKAELMLLRAKPDLIVIAITEGKPLPIHDHHRN